MRTSRRWTLLALAMVGVLILVLASGCGDGGTSSEGSSDTEKAATGLPESSDPALDAGRQLIETKCKMCHTLDRVKTAEHDQAAWEETIARMRGKGAVLTDDEAKQILDYLVSR